MTTPGDSPKLLIQHVGQMQDWGVSLFAVRCACFVQPPSLSEPPVFNSGCRFICTCAGRMIPSSTFRIVVADAVKGTCAGLRVQVARDQGLTGLLENVRSLRYQRGKGSTSLILASKWFILPETSGEPLRLSHSHVVSGHCPDAIWPNLNLSRGCPETLPLALEQVGQSLGGPGGPGGLSNPASDVKSLSRDLPD